MGCRDKVQAVAFAPRSKQLLSAGDDRVVAYWNMDIKRLEVGSQQITVVITQVKLRLVLWLSLLINCIACTCCL